jgi:MarR family transcriptional regulator, temperature-dependent positive regulator of motility
MSASKEARPKSTGDMAARWHLDEGIGFLLRLLEARYDALYQSMTRQSDITPRQFGVLMALYQQGPLTPSALAERISCDRNTLSEMLKRMIERKLVVKKMNPEDRRSFQVQITAKGSQALLAVVPAAAELQNVMLAPLSKDDRAHFLNCLRAIAKPPAS